MNLLTKKDIIAALKKEKIALTLRTIQFYRDFDIFPEPVKRIRLPKGGVVAVYSPDIIDLIKRIHALKKNNFTLKEIKVILDRDRSKPVFSADVLSSGSVSANNSNSTFSVNTGPRIVI